MRYRFGDIERTQKETNIRKMKGYRGKQGKKYSRAD